MQRFVKFIQTAVGGKARYARTLQHTSQWTNYVQHKWMEQLPTATFWQMRNERKGSLILRRSRVPLAQKKKETEKREWPRETLNCVRIMLMKIRCVVGPSSDGCS